MRKLLVALAATLAACGGGSSRPAAAPTTTVPYQLTWEVGCLVQLTEYRGDGNFTQEDVLRCARNVQRMTPTQRSVFEANWVPAH